MTASNDAEWHDFLHQRRAAGWAVAVHNDYSLQGQPRTFWLFTHPNGRWVKGEGLSDAIALQEAWEAADGIITELLERRSPEGGEMVALMHIHPESTRDDGYAPFVEVVADWRSMTPGVHVLASPSSRSVELEAADAEVVRLREALEPFAEIGRQIGEVGPERTFNVIGLSVESDGINSHYQGALKGGDFRRARAVLTSKPKE